MSWSEQEKLNERTFTPAVRSHFEQIRQNEQILDAREMLGEISTQNQIPFQESARNFTLVNRYEEAEAKEAQFWRNDREQREERIAREKAQARLKMTDDEKAEQDAIAIDAAAKMEANEEQEREGSAQIL